MSWYHEFDGERAWYTGLGHENWVYQDATFRDHLLGGLKYVLKLDGTTAIADAQRASPGSRARIWLGPLAGATASPLSLPGAQRDFRFFDVRGNRLREIGSGPSAAAPFRMAVGVAHD
jgi:hypothetical protein